MLQKRYIILTLILSLHAVIFAQGDPANPAQANEKIKSGEIKSRWVESNIARVFPEPVQSDYSDDYFNLYSTNGRSNFVILINSTSEQKAANIFNRQLEKFNYAAIKIIKTDKETANDVGVIKLHMLSENLKRYGDQAYLIKWSSGKEKKVTISGASEKGLIYGAASLAQLVVKQNNKVVLRKADILDYPKFSRRIFNTDPMPSQLEDDLDWMVRYKIECLTFNNKDYSWNTMEDDFRESLNIFKNWNDKFGGVEGNIMLNLYRGSEDIEVTNKDHIAKLKEIIKFAYDCGVSRVMLLADDAPPFKYDEGYILTSENDKAKFSTMAEANCWLVNNVVGWKNKNNYDLEIIYCPAFYTYEEMHYGDMELFKDTPWENDAYEPLKRDLKIIGEQMDEEVLLFWTGPFVCTKVLTEDDITDWTENLNGRKPFLFDNTIFINNEFVMRAMFTAYNNDFPKEFHLLTGGNGIFINGDALGEPSKSSSMTTNAYMWEGDSYNPDNSLIVALEKLYGANSINTILNYKETELELCKTIKQRQIRDVADELWQAIRDTRFTTEKNPFHYHLNYGRLKALRLQLKYSVPEPEPFEIYKSKCLQLADKREKLLETIKKMSLYKLNYSLQSEMIKMPNFEPDNINQND